MIRFRSLVAVAGTSAVLLAGALIMVPAFNTAIPDGQPKASTVACPKADPIQVGAITVPAGPVAGYCQPELVNVAQIMNAALDLGLGPHTQAVGVMTAIGESDLVNLTYGDQAGADSRGLFQQRANGAWGTLTDRMDPYTAATNFFTALTATAGWAKLAPTEAAHLVQVNADPNYYTPYFSNAQTIVRTLTP